MTSGGEALLRKVPLGEPWSINTISDYTGLVDRMRAKPSSSYLRYRSVTPMWDNTARRRPGATVFLNSTPKRYGD